MPCNYTPRRGKICAGEKLCCVNNLTSQLTGKGYNASDYHAVIIIVLKLTLVVEIQALLLCRWPPLRCPLMLIHANRETHHAGEVVSTVIIFCLPFGQGCNGYQECNCPSVIK